MSTPILMPKVGLTMTEGKIVEWHKQVGDHVEKDEIIFVFETEKVTFEFQAPVTGTLVAVTADLDAVVPVGEQVALIAAEGEVPAEAPAPETVPEAPAEVPEAPSPAMTEAVLADAPSGAVSLGGKVRATPLARRLAKEAGIPLEQFLAQSDGQRVREQDVKRALDSAPEAPATAAPAAPVPAPAQPAAPGDRVVPLTGMRRIIAERMVASKTQTAQAYMTLTADVSLVVEARTSLVDAIENGAVKPTLTDFFLKITAAAIAEHPVLNTRWGDDGVIWLEHINMGLATAVGEGLLVPVINGIETMSITQIAEARSDLVTRARAGQLLPEEMGGGTFTLSSLGMFGVEEFSAILNPPEVGILAIGAIIDTPVVVNGEIVIRPMMKATLTYDHRIVDGAQAGAFMQTLKKLIEHPIFVIT